MDKTEHIIIETSRMKRDKTNFTSPYLERRRLRKGHEGNVNINEKGVTRLW